MAAERHDKKIYSTPSSEQVERARRLLLKLKPRPFVYVYIVKDGYDLHVANEWGSMPTAEYIVELKQLLAEKMAVVEEPKDQTDRRWRW